MGSFQNPVGEGSHDPYEHYRVEQIERDKERKRGGGGGDGEPPKEKWGVAAYLLLQLKKVISFFESSVGGTAIDQAILEDLIQLKNAFETLKKEDRSEDIQFLNNLSNVWLRLLEDGLRFNGMKTLVKAIQNYPKNETHTLGYYLSEYAGQKWVPFPYMELVEKIHSDYEKYPELSPLSEWIQMIDELAARLKAE